MIYQTFLMIKQYIVSKNSFHDILDTIPMNILKIILGAVFIPITMHSQSQTDSIQTDSIYKDILMQEVVIESSNIRHYTDRDIYIPNSNQRSHAANGLELLNRMKFQGIKVDEVQKTITSLLNGVVQIRINDVESTVDDLTAIIPSQISKVEYITMPGLKYGKEVSSVLNVHTKRNHNGYAAGLNAMNALTTNYNDDNGWLRLNNGFSEFGFRYGLRLNDNNKIRTNSQQTFQIGNGIQKELKKEGKYNGSNFNSHDVTLSYNYADNSKRVFDAKVLLNWNRFPDRTLDEIISDDDNLYNSSTQYKDTQHSSAIKLYYSENIGKKDFFSTYITMTNLSSRYHRGFIMPYTEDFYSVDGKKYGIYGELNYTRKISNTNSLALGYQQSGAYTGNRYILAESNNNFNMHDDMQYLFAEYSTKLQRLGIKLGIGISREHFSNDITSYTYWMFRPNINIQYSFSDSFSLSYQYQNEPTIPSLSQLTAFFKRDNFYEASQGNANLKPYQSNINNLSLKYQTKLSYFSLTISHKYSTNLICSNPITQIIDENDYYFLYTLSNNADMHRLQLSLYADRYIGNKKFFIYAMPYLTRDIIDGKEYAHINTCWNLKAGASLYLGNFAIDFDYESPSEKLNGETIIRNLGSSSLSISYKWPHLSAKLGCRNMFTPKGTGSQLKQLSPIVCSYIETRNNAFGNMLYLSLSYNIFKGKKHMQTRIPNKNISLDSGIVK